MGIIFQDFQLLHDHTVYQNLRFVLRATGWRDKKAINERIDEVLTDVGMLDKRDKMPSELSGGEQQRIAIARSRRSSSPTSPPATSTLRPPPTSSLC